MKKILLSLLSVFLMFNLVTKNVHALSRGGGMGFGYGYGDIQMDIKQVGNELRFSCNDNRFLAQMEEKCSINFYEYLEDDLGERPSLSRKLLQTFNNDINNNHIVEIKDGYAVIENIDTMFRDGNYQVEVDNVAGSIKTGFGGGVTISNCIEPSTIDNIEFSENPDGSVKISCDDEDYIKNIYQIIITPSSSRIIHISSSFEIDANSKRLSFSFGEDSAIENETIHYYIESFGYKSKNGDLELSHQPLKSCPEFTTSLNEQGDLLITSDDEDWINALCENRIINETISGEYKSGTIDTPDYKHYSFSDSNSLQGGPEPEYITEYKEIVKKDNRTVCYPSTSQRTNGGCVNGITYSVTLQAKGYVRSRCFDIVFTNASKLYPLDTEFIITGNVAIIHSSDESFISYCHSSNYSIGFGMINGHRTIEIDLNSDFSQKGILIDPNTICFDLSKVMNNEHFAEFYTNDTYLYVGPPLYGTSETEYIYANSVNIDDETIKVKASATQYNVSFNGNGASGSKESVHVGGYYSLPDQTGFETPSGKEFIGWTVGSDTTERFTNEKVIIFEDKELKAIWKDLPAPTLEVNDSQIEVGKVVKLEPNENPEKATLKSSDNLLSEEDKTAGAAVWMEVEPIENTSSDWTRMQRGFALENEGELKECMEINIFKKVKGQDATKVSETVEEATISFDLTGKTELINLAKNNQLFVYSIHNGKVSDLITGTFDSSTNIFTFKAKQFSVFGFFKMGEPNPTQHDSGSGNGSTRSTYSIPNTGIK